MPEHARVHDVAAIKQRLSCSCKLRTHCCTAREQTAHVAETSMFKRSVCVGTRATYLADYMMLHADVAQLQRLYQNAMLGERLA